MKINMWTIVGAMDCLLTAIYVLMIALVTGIITYMLVEGYSLRCMDVDGWFVVAFMAVSIMKNVLNGLIGRNI